LSETTPLPRKPSEAEQLPRSVRRQQRAPSLSTSRLQITDADDVISHRDHVCGAADKRRCSEEWVAAFEKLAEKLRFGAVAQRICSECDLAARLASKPLDDATR
jgi:hypothetical protein